MTTAKKLRLITDTKLSEVNISFFMDRLYCLMQAEAAIGGDRVKIEEACFTKDRNVTDEEWRAVLRTLESDGFQIVGLVNGGNQARW